MGDRLPDDHCTLLHSLRFWNDDPPFHGPLSEWSASALNNEVCRSLTKLKSSGYHPVDWNFQYCMMCRRQFWHLRYERANAVASHFGRILGEAVKVIMCAVSFVRLICLSFSQDVQIEHMCQWVIYGAQWGFNKDDDWDGNPDLAVEPFQKSLLFSSAIRTPRVRLQGVGLLR